MAQGLSPCNYLPDQLRSRGVDKLAQLPNQKDAQATIVLENEFWKNRQVDEAVLGAVNDHRRRMDKGVKQGTDVVEIKERLHIREAPNTIHLCVSQRRRSIGIVGSGWRNESVRFRVKLVLDRQFWSASGHSQYLWKSEEALEALTRPGLQETLSSLKKKHQARGPHLFSQNGITSFKIKT